MLTTLTIQQTPANFVPTTLKHDKTGWYITYYAFNPFIGKLARKKIKLNMLRRRCKSMLEFKVQVGNIMNTIDNQLRINATEYARHETSPSHEPLPTPTKQSENIRHYTTVEDVTKIFEESRKREVRETTMRSYKSFCKMLRDWVKVHYPSLMMAQFSRTHAVEFLESIEEKEVGARTYNNMIRLGSAFFTWAKEKCYISENPFEHQKRKRVLEKKRTIITPEHQVAIDSWFKENRPEMRIVTRMIYTSLLRPIEITRVQVKQLDFKKHCIVMPEDKTKTWTKREGRMDEELEQMLLEHTKYASPEDYVFSSNKMLCGKQSISDKSFRKAWDKMRKALKLPEEYQLYSLKDTALFSMLKAGVDDLSVMQAAGHKDLSMTTIYANHHDQELIKNLNQKAPKFAGSSINNWKE